MRTLFCLFGFAVAVAAQQPRFPQLKLEDTSGEQKALAERMLKETRVGLGGPWNIMLRSPSVGSPVMDLYNYFRFNSSLSTRIVELGILVTAREWQSSYEWYIHYPLAVQAGVAADTLAAVREGKRPSAAQPDEIAAYDFSAELLRKHEVSSAVFASARKSLGEQGVVDLTALVGTYVAIGGLLNVSEVGGPDKNGPEYLPKLTAPAAAPPR